MALPYDPYVNQFISGRQWATDTYNTAGGGDAGASSIATLLSQITPEDFANYSPNDQGLIYQILTGAGLPTSSLNYSPTTSPFGLSSGLNINPSLSGPNPDLQVFNTGTTGGTSGAYDPGFTDTGFIGPMNARWDMGRLVAPGTVSMIPDNWMPTTGSYNDYLTSFYNTYNSLDDVNRIRFRMQYGNPLNEAGWTDHVNRVPVATQQWQDYNTTLANRAATGQVSPTSTPGALAPTPPSTTTPAVTPPTPTPPTTPAPGGMANFTNTNNNNNAGVQQRPYLNLGSGNNNPNFGGTPGGAGGGMNDFTKAGGNTNWWEM